MATYVLLKVEPEPDSKVISLTERDLELIQVAVDVCTRTGGGSAMNTLGIKLTNFTGQRSDLKTVWETQKDIHHEVEAFYAEERNDKETA